MHFRIDDDPERTCTVPLCILGETFDAKICGDLLPERHLHTERMKQNPLP